MVKLFVNHRDSRPRANEITAAASNYLAMASCVTVKNKQLERVLGEG